MSCKDCPLKGRPKMKVKPNTHPFAMIYRAPSKMEVKEQEWGANKAGRRLKLWCKEEGIPWASLHHNAAIQCYPPYDFKDWAKAIECCRSRLERQLKKAGVEYILAYGEHAWSGVVEKKKWYEWHGEEYEHNGRKILSTWAPSFALQGKGAYWDIIWIHSKRAWRLHQGEEEVLPWPEIVVEPDEYMVECLERLAKERVLGFDIETLGVNPLKDPITALGFASADLAVSIPFPTEKWFESSVEKKVLRLARRILADPEILLAAQNCIHDVAGMRSQGWDVEGVYYDTLIQSHIYAPEIQKHDLGALATWYFALPRWKTIFGAKGDEKGDAKWAVTNYEEWMDLGIYNGQDAWTTRQLALKQHDVLETEVHRGVELYENKIKLNEIAIKKYMRGILIDVEEKERLYALTSAKQKEAQKELDAIGRETNFTALYNATIADPKKHLLKFNAESTKQLRFMLFKVLGVIPTKRTESGEWSTDKEVLKKLLTSPDERVRRLCRSLLTKRKWRKLESSYLSNLPLDENNVTHPVGKSYGARTGRWTYTEPAIQTIPKVTHEVGGRKLSLRNLIRARGNGWVVEADYKNLEVFIIAYLSGEKGLIAAQKNSEDVHRKVAEGLYPSVEITKQLRGSAKTFEFKLNYGGTDYKSLHEQLALMFDGITLKDVVRMADRYFISNPRIKKWHKDALAFARTYDYMECPISGRRFYYYGNVEPPKVYNPTIQGTGSDLIDRAMIGLDKELRWDETEGILFQAHDAMILETDRVVWLCERLKHHMEKPVMLCGHEVSLGIDFKIGKRWGEAVEYGTIEEVYGAANKGVFDV